MPVILRWNGYRFFFYSNEGNPLEPAHIHVQNGDAEAKFWLKPIVSVARNDGFGVKQLNVLIRVVEEHQDIFVEAWHEYFS